MSVTAIDTNLTSAVQLVPPESLFVNSSIPILLKLITMQLISNSVLKDCSPLELKAIDKWQVKCLENKMARNSASVHFQCFDDQPQLNWHLHLSDFNITQAKMVS